MANHVKIDNGPFVVAFSIFEGDDNVGKKQKPSSYEHFRNRISNIMANKANITPHAVSTAMDARLESGVQLAAELRLKVNLGVIPTE